MSLQSWKIWVSQSSAWDTLGHSQSCYFCVRLDVCFGLLEAEPLAQSEVPSVVEQVFIEDIIVLCSIQLTLNTDHHASLLGWHWASN